MVKHLDVDVYLLGEFLELVVGEGVVHGLDIVAHLFLRSDRVLEERGLLRERLLLEGEHLGEGLEGHVGEHWRAASIHHEGRRVRHQILLLVEPMTRRVLTGGDLLLLLVFLLFLCIPLIFFWRGLDFFWSDLDFN